MHNKSIAELGAALRAGEFSSVELTRHFLERIEKLDGEVNSYITVTPELALAAADAAERHFLHQRRTHQLRVSNVGQFYLTL